MLLVLLLYCPSGFAQGSSAAPGQGNDEYSEYEQDIADQTLREKDLVLEPEPQGKRIESIEIVVLDVFDERDPVPDFLNVFHVTSRRHVIRRELLFDEGDTYDGARIEESARNLRDLRQLSLVLLIPVRGSRPDRVRVLVITKDVWSLRINSNFEIDNGHLASLLLNPSEENLVGTHTSIGLLYTLQPDTYSIGGLFRNRRVAGSRIQTSLNGNLILNRQSGEAEGSFGYVFYGQPLYSLAARWGWGATVAWREEITRVFKGVEQRFYDARLPTLAGLAGLPGSPCPGDPRCIPYIYSSERWVGEWSVIRSFGHQYKYDFTFGAEADRRLYRAPDLSAYDPAAATQFKNNEIPVSDTRISPVVQLRAYSSRFLRVLDFETLGLQEDYSLGHELFLRFYPASRDVGSSRDMLGTFAALSYTLPLGDGLVRALAASTVEFEFHDRHDALVDLGLRVTTPRLGFGRFVYDTVLSDRYRNYLNRRLALGGDTRLRGYPSQAFLGTGAVASNLEFRSRPIEILSAQIGCALFYDVGDAFYDFGSIDLKQSAGFGVRALFPQANRSVFRADWGFPLSVPYRTFPGSIFITFRQAFGMPALSSPSIAGSFIESTE